jgi:hypothetical protein
MEDAMVTIPKTFSRPAKQAETATLLAFPPTPFQLIKSTVKEKGERKWTRRSEGFPEIQEICVYKYCFFCFHVPEGSQGTMFIPALYSVVACTLSRGHI